MRKLHFLTIVCLSILFIFYSKSARAIYTISGNQADQESFLNILNGASFGGSWTIDNQNLQFNQTGSFLNYFAETLNSYNQGNNRTIELGRGIPNVIIAAFLGSGKQKIDLDDLEIFPISEPLRQFDTQSSVLLHELVEVGENGGKPDYEKSHKIGAEAQNEHLLRDLDYAGQRDISLIEEEKELGQSVLINSNEGVFTIPIPWIKNAFSSTPEKTFQELVGKAVILSNPNGVEIGKDVILQSIITGIYNSGVFEDEIEVSIDFILEEVRENSNPNPNPQSTPEPSFILGLLSTIGLALLKESL